MIDLLVVNEFVYEHFEKVKTSKNGNHFLARCLFCGDSKKNPYKKRFNLDYNNGNPIFQCFNCSKSGSFLELYSEILCISIEDAKKELFGFDPDYLIQKLSKRKKDKIEKLIEYETYNYIINECASENKKIDSLLNENYINLLKKFREDRRIPKNYKIFYAYDGDYKGRIIIPIYDNNKDIIYFQARRVPGSNILPKYKNPTLEKGNTIFNADKFDRNKSIIIFEGLLDAMMLGNQGTTCLGKFISDDFLSKVISKTNESTVVAFDNDGPGFESMIKFMKESKYNKRVLYFLMPKEYNNCTDINECVVRNKLEDTYKFIMDNSFSYISTYSLVHINHSWRK